MIFLVEKKEKLFAYEFYKRKGVIMAESRKEANLKLKTRFKKDYNKYRLTKMSEL